MSKCLGRDGQEPFRYIEMPEMEDYMKVSEILNKYDNEYTDYFFFKNASGSSGIRWNCNNLAVTGDAPGDAEIDGHKLMGEEEYNKIFYRPYGDHFSFEEELHDKNAKVLCLVLPMTKKGIFRFRINVKIGKGYHNLFIYAATYQEAQEIADNAVKGGTWHNYLNTSSTNNKKIIEFRNKSFVKNGEFPDEEVEEYIYEKGGTKRSSQIEGQLCLIL